MYHLNMFNSWLMTQWQEVTKNKIDHVRDHMRKRHETLHTLNWMMFGGYMDFVGKPYKYIVSTLHKAFPQ